MPKLSSPMALTIRQVKAARALLGWSQQQLAATSGVSWPTVKRLEVEDGTLGGRADTGEKMRRALEAAGIEFTDGNEPGVKLRRKNKHLFR